MSQDKNRHTAHVSELEKHNAGVHLNEALSAVYANLGPSPVLVQIRAAMKELGIKEDWEQRA